LREAHTKGRTGVSGTLIVTVSFDVIVWAVSEWWWDVHAHAAVPRFLVGSMKAASVWRDYRGVICIAS
jgi:hypothetical protein